MGNGGARVMQGDELKQFNRAQAQVSIVELETAETIKCSNCNAVVWDTGFVMKKTSPLSKVGEQMVQLPVIYCKVCGTPYPESCPVKI